MALERLPALVRGLDALEHLDVGATAVLSVGEPARPFLLAGLAETMGARPILVVVPTQSDADHLANDLVAFLGEDAVDTFGAWETLPFERISPNAETMGRRLRAMFRLRHDPPRVLVTTARALVQRLGPHVEDVQPVCIRQGDVLDPQELVVDLVAAGYRREHQVEHRGEIAVRGSIVDVFPSTADGPVRIDLWGDEVDRLMSFAVADQRSTGDVDGVEIYPCRELLPTQEVRDRAALLVGREPWGREQWERLSEGLVFEGMESWLPWVTEGEHLLPDLLPDGSLVVLVDPRRLRDRAAEILDEEENLAASLATTWGVPGGDLPRLHLPFDRMLAHTSATVWTMASVPESDDVVTVESSGWSRAGADAAGLITRIDRLRSEGFRVLVCADGAGSAGRLAQSLADAGMTAPVRSREDPALVQPGLSVVVQPLERGFVLPEIKLALIAEADLTGRRRAHRAARARPRQSAGFFDTLQPGDHVVHHHHGVGRYKGMVRRALMGGPERDYLLIEYRDGSLNLPSDQIDLIRPYTGGETPSLNRMGGTDWAKTKARVRSAVAEIAQELVVLYQKRLQSPGHAFAPDTPWQAELEQAFPFTETPDQRKAIDEVKEDMEIPRPMDRLVCGDVGFGKTEIAIRAAMKAVQDGKQVAVLVPTTLLASQHHTTFSDRFAGFPVRVEVLSRFLTTAQARVVTKGVADGGVDIVVGTHKLLAKDLRFKDLGLLIVDEEQRFGVTHKEQIKQLRANVDVLTLSATPIPRTLEMSLTGIRDLSLLNTPPAERQPILTYVGEHDEKAITEAIRRELLREGQVFFVHNRVQDIEQVARRLAELVPEARIAIAHGQMDEGTLEQVVYDFWEGQFDVLVCTTIIESGIDMPTVNTLVVDRADLLGLGQLHQLRGHVGRSGQRAYAYLFHPRDRVLSEEAYERLKTIGEHTELGSGFKIAMRDLEIRGAGNLLGGNQSGHIAAVGYDLYVQMVSEAVADLKGEPVPIPAEVKIDVPVEANLPVAYVERDDTRLEAYRRLAGVTTHAEVDDIRAEWLDRFGPLPPPAEGLIAVGRLRAEAHRLSLRDIVVAKGGAAGFDARTIRLGPLELKTSQQLRLQRLHPKAVHKADGQVVLPVPPKVKDADVAAFLVDLLQELVPPEPAEDPVPGARVTPHVVRGLLAAIVLLVGCAKDDAAATVDGTEISEGQMDRDLEDIASNEAFVKGREAEGVAFRGTRTGSLDPGIVAELLSRKITAVLVHDELARRRLTVRPEDRVAAEQTLRRQVVAGRSAESVLDRFPRRYVEAQVTTQAESDVLQADEGKVDLSDEALRRLYDERQDDLEVTCARWILWLPTDGDAARRAEEARARIAGGADFAAVAAAESTDAGTASQGGSLGCQSDERFARLGENVAEVIEHLGTGEMSERATAEVGTFLVQVTERRTQPFDEARPVIRAAALEPAGVPYELLLRRLRAAAKVTVRPRYGTWDTSDPERIRLVPPRRPTGP